MSPSASSTISSAKDDAPQSHGGSTEPGVRLVDRLGTLPVADREVRIVLDALENDLRALFRDSADETSDHE